MMVAVRSILFGLKNCDTCRKALKACPELKLVDIRAEGVPEGALRAALTSFGEQLINKRSTTWRGLNEDERSEDPMTLLRAHPTLMKRPLIQIDEALFLGWSTEVERRVRAEL